jgi:hypothetical protein
VRLDGLWLCAWRTSPPSAAELYSQEGDLTTCLTGTPPTQSPPIPTGIDSYIFFLTLSPLSPWLISSLLIDAARPLSSLLTSGCIARHVLRAQATQSSPHRSRGVDPPGRRKGRRDPRKGTRDTITPASGFCSALHLLSRLRQATGPLADLLFLPNNNLLVDAISSGSALPWTSHLARRPICYPLSVGATAE